GALRAARRDHERGCAMKRLALLGAMALGACASASPAPARAPASVAAAPPSAAPSSTATPPADPPMRVEGDVTVAWLDGLEVIVKRAAGTELTAARLFVRGGVRNWT